MESRKPVSSAEYSEEYFQSVCDGFEEFGNTKGKAMPKRLQACFRAAGVRRGDIVLDAGCGRGELTVSAAKAGAFCAGMDYSRAGLELSAQAIAKNRADKNAFLVNADVKNLPFRSGTFSKVFFVDVIEHLHQWEVEMLMRELGRVMKKGGRLVIETSPNALLAKPLYFFAGFLGLGRGPVNVRVHVNEQTWFSLSRLMKRHGFRARVWAEFDAGWFRAAVAGKRNARFVIPLIKIMEKKWFGRAVEASGLGIFLSPRLWCVAEKE